MASAEIAMKRAAAKARQKAYQVGAGEVVWKDGFRGLTQSGIFFQALMQHLKVLFRFSASQSRLQELLSRFSSFSLHDLYENLNICYLELRT